MAKKCLTLSKKAQVQILLKAVTRGAGGLDMSDFISNMKKN
ncbi:hypothetical protein [Aquibacillus koreensis]|nr:hypothetical protein [Aquibacillus koreensis]